MVYAYIIKNNLSIGKFKLLDGFDHPFYSQTYICVIIHKRNITTILK